MQHFVVIVLNKKVDDERFYKRMMILKGMNTCVAQLVRARVS